MSYSGLVMHGDHVRDSRRAGAGGRATRVQRRLGDRGERARRDHGAGGDGGGHGAVRAGHGDRADRPARSLPRGHVVLVAAGPERGTGHGGVRGEHARDRVGLARAAVGQARLADAGVRRCVPAAHVGGAAAARGAVPDAGAGNGRVGAADPGVHRGAGRADAGAGGGGRGRRHPELPDGDRDRAVGAGDRAGYREGGAEAGGRAHRGVPADGHRRVVRAGLGADQEPNCWPI